ncbi:MFS transporter, putative [Bodo saltans]|uniref:MFS transporter, putative n=1 Tax=Bodo saltans TaxID=75058 RepID=A0A0S4JEW2_BODSA|nr:MFS transporter, putative [Bodo saltans]|eukprot:CUG88710.1 MFS transporter, putative [Bodo saltans]
MNPTPTSTAQREAEREESINVRQLSHQQSNSEGEAKVVSESIDVIVDLDDMEQCGPTSGDSCDDAPSSTPASAPAAADPPPAMVLSGTSSRRLFRELVVGLAFSVHIPNFLQGATTGMRTSLIPIFAKELGADDGTIGIITAAAGIARMIANFPAGQLTTKHGFSFVMTIGMASVIIGSIIAAIAWAPYVLSLSNFFLGAGIGIFFLSRHVMLSTIVEKKQRGRLMSMIGGVERWSSVAGPLVAGLLIEIGGSRLASISMAPIAAVCIFFVHRSARVRQLDDKFKTENAVRAALERENSENALIRDLPTLLRLYGGLVVRVGVYAMNVIQLRACRKLLLPLAAINAGLRPSVVGLIISTSFAIDATLFFLGGMVMDKFGRKFSAIPTTVNLGLSFLLLGQAQSTLSLFIAAIAFGFGDALGSGLLLTLNADHVPKKAGPEFMGILRTVQDSGQLFGPLIAGWLSDGISLQAACNFFGVLGIANAVWAVIMLPTDASDEDPEPPVVVSSVPTSMVSTTTTTAIQRRTI